MLFELWRLEGGYWFLVAMIAQFGFGMSSQGLVNGSWLGILTKARSHHDSHFSGWSLTRMSGL